MAFLSKWFAGATTRNSRLGLPWSLSRWERNKDAIDPVGPAEVFGADLAQVLREHYEKNCRPAASAGLGIGRPAADLEPLLAPTARTSSRTKASIRSVVRSMPQASARLSTVLFEVQVIEQTAQRRDRRRCRCADLKTKAVGVRTPGCSLSIKIELPDKPNYRERSRGCVRGHERARQGVLWPAGATEDDVRPSRWLPLPCPESHQSADPRRPQRGAAPYALVKKAAPPYLRTCRVVPAVIGSPTAQRRTCAPPSSLWTCGACGTRSP